MHCVVYAKSKGRQAFNFVLKKFSQNKCEPNRKKIHT